MSIPIYQVKVPEYQTDVQPDFKTIGAKIDRCIIKHFLDQKLAIRGIGSQDHPGKSTDDLIKIIKKIGTDRYDPNRKGDRYENVENKQIDIFALDFKITEKGKYLEQFIEPFYFWPKKFGEKPIKLDVIILYDRAKMKKVAHKYEGRNDIKKDGFVFKEPENKAGAIKGIIKIT
ncbi:MAG: hypothetical protein PHX25_00705 [Candidatus Pacebacteria bacterium]|nr:hypothetical protein [Candidatus Paceibacterota bacterium]